MLNLLSRLADIGLAAPLIVLALVTLMARGHLRVALCWGGGILLGLGVVVIIKRLLGGDAALPHFPSGHVALSVTFYGGLILVLVRDEMPPTIGRPLVFFAILSAIALTEGTSRIVLTEHDWIDVVGGFLVGVIGMAVAGNPWAWAPIGRLDRLVVAGVLVVAFPLVWVIYPHIDPCLRRFAGL